MEVHGEFAGTCIAVRASGRHRSLGAETPSRKLFHLLGAVRTAGRKPFLFAST